MNVLCIFPHPDDESFAVAGTIKLLTQNGHRVDLAVLTDATSGTMHPDIYQTGKNLRGPGDIRFEELQHATEILGISHTEQLHYHDGHITNDDFYSQRLVDDIVKLIMNSKPDMVVTYDMTGISWHTDHILTTLATLKACNQFKDTIKALLLFTAHKEQVARYDYFYTLPYMATHEVDISSVKQIKKQAIMAHKSQKHDWQRFMEKNKEAFEREQFIVKKIDEKFTLPTFFKPVAQ